MQGGRSAQRRGRSGGITFQGGKNASTHDDFDVLYQNVWVGAHILVQPMQDMCDDTQCEVVDDEITVLGGKRRKNWSCCTAFDVLLRCLTFKLSDNRSHHFAEGMIKKFFHFFTAERGHDSVGLLAVLTHIDQEIT